MFSTRFVAFATLALVALQASAAPVEVSTIVTDLERLTELFL
jgi:hypothetical protein